MSYEDILEALPQTEIERAFAANALPPSDHSWWNEPQATSSTPAAETVTVSDSPADAETASYDVLDVTAPTDAGFPVHRHPWEESLFVLHGEIEVTMARRTIRLRADGSTQIRAGVEHVIRVVSPVANFLVVTPSPLGTSSVRSLNLSAWPSRATLDTTVLEALEKTSPRVAA
jgi:quercetin dioxygenase-like cupin family protein